MRKRIMLERIEREGSILVKELADEFSISETTIRRDLNELHAAGLLKQVYGGAVRMDKEMPGAQFSITHRSVSETASKKLIGKCAASLVNDHDIIYVDPGTTTWEMIPHLKEKNDLTIISNSVRLIQCLDYIGHHRIIQLGGTLRPERLDTVGALMQLGIEQLRGYKAFQGGDGLDLEFGLSAVDHESALAAKIILANARETCAIADHTKFDQPSLLYKIIDIHKINAIVTDKPLSKPWKEKCAAANIRVVIAEEGEVG